MPCCCLSQNIHHCTLPDLPDLPHHLHQTRRCSVTGGPSYAGLTKGYWQIPLDPNSKEKTAFTTHSGFSHFTRMPFDLHGIPVTFQQLMDHHLEYVAAYLDDVVIYS